jgi:PKD repeat protein
LVNTPFSYTIQATSLATSFSASGLPGGLALNSLTGAITGTPTNAGTYNVTLTASNATGATTSQLTIVIYAGAGPVPAITSPLSAAGMVGSSFNYLLTAANNPTSFFAIGLPAGLSFDPASGRIFGTPSATGTFLVTVRASNRWGTGSASLVLTINTDTDSVGDGIPDWWRAQYFGGDGHSTNNLSCAACDADGTGQNNLLKYLAGLNPTNPASVFRIMSVAVQNTSLLLSWQSGAGRTNVVQAAASLNGAFSNVSPGIVLIGNGDTATNFLDIGGATNRPARFYRIHLAL